MGHSPVTTLRHVVTAPTPHRAASTSPPRSTTAAPGHPQRHPPPNACADSASTGSGQCRAGSEALRDPRPRNAAPAGEPPMADRTAAPTRERRKKDEGPRRHPHRGLHGLPTARSGDGAADGGGG
jgi:hypothetical protein